jgi:hypothetical protein
VNQITLADDRQGFLTISSSRVWGRTVNDLISAGAYNKYSQHNPERLQTKGFFTRADFLDPQANLFVCPAGKQLRSTGLVREGGTMPYWASTKDCRACALKPRCTKEQSGSSRATCSKPTHVRALKGTGAFERSAREPRKVEMAFAHLKRNLGFRRLRLRGSPAPRMNFCWPPLFRT